VVKKIKKKDVTQSDFNDQVLETVDNIHKNVKLVDTKMNMLYQQEVYLIMYQWN